MSYLPETITVNRKALAGILTRINSGGFLSNDLGIKYAPDEHGAATVLISDAEALSTAPGSVGEATDND